MDYFTKYSATTDAPNQNLYNCRYSRVLNSSEIADTNANNKPVQFITDKFKNITGGDTIYARELGTKNTAYFIAGKPLFQTNVMPSFPKINKPLIDRMVVVPFPYTFVNSEDPLLLQNPSVYKLRDNDLKEKFSTEIYKNAMILELFEWYKEYKIEFKPTLDIMNHTKSYFNSSGIKSFIMGTYTYMEKTKILISDIQKCYEDHSDKKLTIKQICEELIENDFEIKKIKGYYYLKDYSIEENVELDEEEI